MQSCKRFPDCSYGFQEGTQRETAYSPFVPEEISDQDIYPTRPGPGPGHGPVGNGSGLDPITPIPSGDDEEIISSVQRQEVVLLDDEIVFNEAITEERMHGII